MRGRGELCSVGSDELRADQPGSGRSESRVTVGPDGESLIIFWREGDELGGSEKWTPCFGYELDYLISTHGRVMRASKVRGTRPGKILKGTPAKNGYLTVNLSREGVRKTFNLHKLVARTFLGNPPEDEFGEFQVHHGPDPSVTNNRAENLSYVTQKDNLEEQRQRLYQTR